MPITFAEFEELRDKYGVIQIHGIFAKSPDGSLRVFRKNGDFVSAIFDNGQIRIIRAIPKSDIQLKQLRFDTIPSFLEWANTYHNS